MQKTVLVTGGNKGIGLESKGIGYLQTIIDYTFSNARKGSIMLFTN